MSYFRITAMLIDVKFINRTTYGRAGIQFKFKTTSNELILRTFNIPKKVSEKSELIKALSRSDMIVTDRDLERSTHLVLKIKNALLDRSFTLLCEKSKNPKYPTNIKSILTTISEYFTDTLSNK